MSLDAIDVNDKVLGNFRQNGHILARVQPNLIVKFVPSR